MAKLPYFPARDCRHRVAAIALYRALIQTARQITLPPNSHKNISGDDNIHPIVQVVRRRFQGNKGYTSLRLVYSSMTAGYKFLDMLHKAKVPESVEYKKIVGLLGQIEAKAAAREAVYETRRAENSAKETYDWKNRHETDFMIRNTAHPQETPHYKGSARPLSSLKKRRVVPRLAAETYSFPFLRYGNTQPVGLNHMIRSHKSRWVDTVYKLKAQHEEVLPTVQWEDVWEQNLEKAMCEEEGSDPPKLDEMDPDPQSSYTWAVQVGKLWYVLKLETLWQDFVARGKALAKIVEEEKRLQELEDEQGIWDKVTGERVQAPGGLEGKDMAMPMAPEGIDPALFADVMKQYGYKTTASPSISHPPTRQPDNLRVQSFASTQPAWDYWQQALAQYRRENNGQYPELDAGDPYINPIWGKNVELSDKRLRKLMAGAPNAGANIRFKMFLNKGPRQADDDEFDDIVGFTIDKVGGNSKKAADLEW